MKLFLSVHCVAIALAKSPLVFIYKFLPATPDYDTMQNWQYLLMILCYVYIECKPNFTHREKVI